MNPSDPDSNSLPAKGWRLVPGVQTPLAGGIVSEPIAVSGPVRVTRFRFAAGAVMEEHTTTRNALVQMVEGECDFTVGGAVRRIKAGDLLLMEPGEPHALAAGAGPFTFILTTFK